MLLNVFMNIIDYWYVLLVALVVIILIIILKAKKKEIIKECTIEFDTNCDIVVENITVNEGENLPHLPILSRNGYNFKGWFIDKELKNNVPKNTIINQNLVVYAKWEEQTMQEFLNQISTETIQKNILKKIRSSYKDSKDN